LSIVIFLAVLSAASGRAADLPLMESTTGAGLAFARYTANADRALRWKQETVEIQASLPKLEESGRMRAIRRLLPTGEPDYQVLEVAGDQTVKRQVMARYLAADAKAAAIPPSTVAVTPENYRFRYKGPVKCGESVAYVFLITPRKKREGLIKGELWLDGDTGAVVRESGHLAKNPSIFVKRVEVTRETLLDNGIASARVTHLSIITRFVGPAELTVVERPLTASQGPSVGAGER
jgi:hypothetical protein